MSWRTVVISNSAKLDYQLGFLVVRREDVVKIHMSEITILIIETTAVSLTAALLSELTKRKIKVIFCDEKRNPSSELIPYYGAHDTSAKVYFNALFGMDFTRTSENSINAALNYGYGIILSACNREITANGYITQLGLFHDNMFNQFNLGSDIMEPFRPLVDEIVKKMNPQKFEHEEKVEVLKLLQKEVVIAGRKENVNNAMKIYCRSVFDALNDMDASQLKFYRYEL